MERNIRNITTVANMRSREDSREVEVKLTKKDVFSLIQAFLACRKCSLHASTSEVSCTGISLIRRHAHVKFPSEDGGDKPLVVARCDARRLPLLY
jgi:hypothetical protein